MVSGSAHVRRAVAAMGVPTILAAARGVIGLGGWPDALIIGASKCGTTTLFHYLQQHPDVGRTRAKEVHYFDLHFHRGPYWYRGQFAGRRSELKLEATPYYIFHPAVPKRAAELVPKAKLIVLLREPVSRAYSQYQHERESGYEQLGFEEAVAMEAQRLGDSHERLAQELIRRSHAHQHFSYVRRGLYAEQIERWQKYYPVESFLFLRAEDLFDAPQNTFDQACAFLGIPTFALDDVSGRNRRNYEGMRPETRRKLTALYDEPNHRLAALTGISWPSAPTDHEP